MICNFSYNIKTSTSFLFLVCSYQLNIWYEVRVPSLTLNTQLAFFHLNTSFNYRGCFILSLLFSVRENGGWIFTLFPQVWLFFVLNAHLILPFLILSAQKLLCQPDPYNLHKRIIQASTNGCFQYDMVVENECDFKMIIWLWFFNST